MKWFLAINGGSELIRLAWHPEELPGLHAAIGVLLIAGAAVLEWRECP